MARGKTVDVAAILGGQLAMLPFWWTKKEGSDDFGLSGAAAR